ncbi:MAG: peroxiredoxin [Candidatus Hodarchaeota archaeon]
MLKVGDLAPEFILLNKDEKEVKLSDFKGRSVVLFFLHSVFYPRSITEILSFKEKFEDFKKKNVEIIGISADAPIELKKFSEEHKIPFELLSALNEEIVTMYWVYSPKVGLKRSTFLINEQGYIKKIFWLIISPKNHAKDVLLYF